MSDWKEEVDASRVLLDPLFWATSLGPLLEEVGRARHWTRRGERVVVPGRANVWPRTGSACSCISNLFVGKNDLLSMFK